LNWINCRKHDSTDYQQNSVDLHLFGHYHNLRSATGCLSQFTYKFTYQPDSSDVQSKQLPPLRTRKLLATTRPKFREVEKAYREGTVARIMNGPFGTEVPASRLQQIRERIKKNNNILERR